MSFQGIIMAGTSGLQRGLEELQFNAERIARARADSPEQKNVQANAETGVAPLPKEVTESRNAPVNETARTAGLMVEQKEILRSFEANGFSMRVASEVLSDLLEKT